MPEVMPPVATARLAGIDVAYHQAGPASGPPVVLLHGFPELAYSWRRQIGPLASAGYLVLVPDQRGYGATGGPVRTELYDLEHLVGDVVALLAHLGYERAVVCGHDWGGLVAWELAVRHPDLVAGVASICTPHMPRLPADPIDVMRQMAGDDMYIVRFQAEGDAEAVLEEDLERTFRFFFRDGQTAYDEFATLDLLGALARFDAGDRRGQLLDDDALAEYVRAFGRTGFRRPLAWYRNFSRNWRATAGADRRVTAPALMVSAELDPILPPSMAEGMEALVPDLTRVVLPGCGHWVQVEAAEALNRTILHWLDTIEFRRLPWS